MDLRGDGVTVALGRDRDAKPRTLICGVTYNQDALKRINDRIAESISISIETHIFTAP